LTGAFIIVTVATPIEESISVDTKSMFLVEKLHFVIPRNLMICLSCLISLWLKRSNIPKKTANVRMLSSSLSWSKGHRRLRYIMTRWVEFIDPATHPDPTRLKRFAARKAV